MNKIVLHIPHSSERLPHGFLKHILIDKQEVLQFCHLIADNNTKQLFGNNKCKRVVFDWSRIFCDVEKFIDPQKEIMSQFGMGVVYTKTNTGEKFFNPTKDYINNVIKRYYLPHHKKLDKIVKKCLKKGPVILVDCHSFCKDIIMFQDKKQDLPDICIGYNEPSETKVSKFVKDYFTDLGYKVKENYPYNGSMIPDFLLQTPNVNFASVMIEINKALYINNPDNFKRLQKQINHLLLALEHLPL